MAYSFNPVSNSSSSDSDGDGNVYADTTQYDQYEDHAHKKCKYIPVEITVGGRHLRIYVRSCRCGNYIDRKGLLNDPIDLNEYDGKEVHTNGHCTWWRNKIKQHGNKVYRLKRQCVCRIRQQQVSQTRSMNSVF